jgi:hypothetical protein
VSSYLARVRGSSKCVPMVHIHTRAQPHVGKILPLYTTHLRALPGLAVAGEGPVSTNPPPETWKTPPPVPPMTRVVIFISWSRLRPEERGEDGTKSDGVGRDVDSHLNQHMDGF